MNVAEQLGFSKNDRLLIVNADDFGLCHSANTAVAQLLEEKAISSATLMMPCGWAREAARLSAEHPEWDIGVHLTFTSEWEPYKWGPVTRNGNTSSLVTDEGYFPPDSKTFERNADREQVRAEIISQVEMALRMGLHPTHLDNHMGSLYGLETGRNFLDIVFEICAEYKFPFRTPRSLAGSEYGGSDALAEHAKMVASFADAKGIVILDYLLSLPYVLEEGETYDLFKGKMAGMLRSLKPGVSEIIIHPAFVSEELKSINPHWAKRGMEFDVFRDPDIRQLLADEKIRMIRWADLRELQLRL